MGIREVEKEALMAIFVDTGDIREVEKFLRMGVLRGVTTNPSILLKDGVQGGFHGIRKRSVKCPSAN